MAYRISSLFCSSKCRVATHRAKKKKAKILDNMISSSRAFVDHKRTKRLDTIGGISRDTEARLRSLYYDTNAATAEIAIDACWQMLIDLQRV